MVLATGGGIVSEPLTFDLILSSFYTVWLKAEPEEHMARVRRQGDLRPMADDRSAMTELRTILRSREPLYARASAAVVDELNGPRPVKPVKLLGENLVLFRDEQGRYGLIERHCAHRGADLAFGRLENGGLRCAFHGWLFDATGQCLETPAEPQDSQLCKGIKQRAYPVVEKSGILWAYLGEGEPPAFPEIDCFVAPDSHTFAFKGHINCNWLQLSLIH